MNSYTLPGIPSDLLIGDVAGKRQLKVNDETFRGLFDKTFDPQSGAMQQLDRFHYATHKGYTYSIDYEFVLSGTTPQYAEIAIGEREIHMQERGIVASSSDIMVELFYNPTVTVGTSVSIPITRFNFAKDVNHDVTARTVDSFTGGESAGRTIIYGEEGVGNNSAGSGVATDREINFPPNSVLGVKVQRRTGTGETRVKIDFGFYEIWGDV